MRLAGLAQRILQHKDALTQAEQALAAFLLRHGEKLAFWSAERLGQEVGISDSTVVRFARTLGFGSYSELQAHVQQELDGLLQSPAHARLRERAAAVDERHPLHRSVLTDIRNLEAILEQVDPATFDAVVEAVVRARQRFVVGLRGSAAVALLLGYNLRGLVPGVRVITAGFDDWLDHLLDLGPEDVVVAISFSREARRTLQFAAQAKRKGATVVGIVNNPLGAVAGLADYVLSVESDSTAFNPSFTAALALVQALLAAVGRAVVSRAEERLAEIDAILVEAEVFTHRLPPPWSRPAGPEATGR